MYYYSLKREERKERNEERILKKGGTRWKGGNLVGTAKDAVPAYPRALDCG